MQTKITWEQLHINLPDTLYIGIRIAGQTLQIQLDRKNDLLADNFSSEDVLDIQAKEGNGLERRLVDSLHLHCYYAGFVFGMTDSKVTISTCDGLVSDFPDFYPAFPRFLSLNSYTLANFAFSLLEGYIIWAW